MPTTVQLRAWYEEWQNGRSKNEIERIEMNDPSSHGKAITKLWRNELGIETEGRHGALNHIDYLERLLTENGVPFNPYRPTGDPTLF